MATMYCNLCKRPVEARRHIGVGTLILALFTAGISLILIPFYSKRCSICKSAAVSRIGPTNLNDKTTIISSKGHESYSKVVAPKKNIKIYLYLVMLFFVLWGCGLYFIW